MRSIVLLCMSLGVAAGGSETLGSLCSTGKVQVRGVEQNFGGVLCWPAFGGDDIATRANGAVILMRDGSRLLVDRESELKLDLRDGRVVLILVKGAVHFRLTEKSRMEISGATLESGVRQGLATVRSGKVSITTGAPPALAGLDGDILMKRFPSVLGPTRAADLK